MKLSLGKILDLGHPCSKFRSFFTKGLPGIAIRGGPGWEYWCSGGPRFRPEVPRTLEGFRPAAEAVSRRGRKTVGQADKLGETRLAGRLYAMVRVLPNAPVFGPFWA